MKQKLLVLYSTLIFSQLIAEEEETPETATLYFELGEISAPLSFYTENWDPKQELPIFLPGGKRVEEKDLIVSIEKAPRKSEDENEQDHENNWNEGR